ncbi:MAG: saccharopine dehydrogenase NADP-binding domain-containing protein [Chloroflexi bacterium]|nr:saccharopine dehydrogenase NADP-binding domain-containing protein [Chloroflexota bacterium]
MTRVLVLGAGGFFGGLILRELRAMGHAGIVIGRDPRSQLRLDANDRAALVATLRRGDLVLDAAGTFATRTSALVEAAIETGADVIDIADDLGYAERVRALEPRIASAAIRVLNGSSAVSAVAAALVRRSGITEPLRVSALLAPASAETASDATIHAVLGGLGSHIRVWRSGTWWTARCWREARRFGPLGRGHLVESALSLSLPAIWPGLRAAELWVDPNVPLGSSLLALAARARPLASLVRASAPAAKRVARLLGSHRGRFAVEIEEAGGRTVRYELSGPGSHLVAVTPALLAAREILAGRFPERGLIAADRQLPGDWLEWLGARDIALRAT